MHRTSAPRLNLATLPPTPPNTGAPPAPPTQAPPASAPSRSRRRTVLWSTLFLLIGITWCLLATPANARPAQSGGDGEEVPAGATPRQPSWSLGLTEDTRLELSETFNLYSRALHDIPPAERGVDTLLHQQSLLQDELGQILPQRSRDNLLEMYPLLPREVAEALPLEQLSSPGQSCVASLGGLESARDQLSQAGVKVSRWEMAPPEDGVDLGLWLGLARYEMEVAYYLATLAVDDVGLAFYATESAERGLEGVALAQHAVEVAARGENTPEVEEITSALATTLMDLKQAIRDGDRCDLTPIFDDFAPTTALPGETLHLLGENLDHVSRVRVGQVEAAFVSLSPTTLTMAVPEGAVTAPVCVSNTDDTQCSRYPLVVFRPREVRPEPAVGQHGGGQHPSGGEPSVIAANTAPVANAGSNQNVPMATLVTLNGSASSDADGNPLQYSWTILSKPSGSAAALSSATVVKPTFTADLVGSYKFQLIVSDGTANSAASQVTVTAYDPKQLTLTLSPASISTYGVTTGQVSLTETKAADLVVNISSSNLSVATLGQSTVTVPKGQTTSNTFTITSSTQAGSSTITAFANTYKDGSANLTVTSRTFTNILSSSLVGVGRDITGTITLAQPAPTGLAIQVAAPAATIVKMCAADGSGCAASTSVAIAAGQTIGTYVIRGVASGTTTLTATIAGYTTVTTSVTATQNIINVQASTTVGKGQTLPLTVNLVNAATSAVAITFTTQPPGLATITPVTIAAGQTTPTTPPNLTGVDWGNVTIQAVATGYFAEPAAATVGLGLSLTPSSVSVLTSATASATLNLTAPAPTGGLAITLNFDNSALATTPSPVTVAAGATSKTLTITGVSAGTTTLRATGPASVTTITAASTTVVVSNAPAINLTPPTYVGYNMQATLSGSLGLAAPSGNTQVTLTSSDPTRLVLSTSAALAGSTSVTVQVNAGATSLPVVYLQGLASSGTANVTATATGYSTKVVSVNLYPSGFRYYSGVTDFTTTTTSPDKSLNIQACVLQPGTFTYLAQAYLRGGLNQVVSISSSNTAVGTVANFNFTPNLGNTNASFKSGSTAGTTTLTLVQPSGYSAASTGTALVATVTLPPITLNNLTVGKNLQAPVTAALGSPSPAGNTVVTLTTTAAKALLATTATGAGAGSITVTVAAGATSLPTFYVQALTDTGTVAITATATGYTTGSNTVTLVPAGFVLYASVSPSTMSNRAINTTVTATNTTVGVYAVPLDPTTKQSTNASTPTTNAQAVRPGVAPVSVTVTSSLPSVGTIVTSPVSIAAGTSSANTLFDPLTAGVTTLTVGTPAGFTTPANYQTLTATVVGAPITVSSQSNLDIGKNLQNPLTVTLGTAAPAGNTTITLTSSDSSRLLLSTSPTTIGTASVSVIVFAGSTSSATKVYAQALVGTSPATQVIVTAKAPGYADGTATLNLVPSGFVLYAAVSPSTMSNRAFSTTTFSANTTLGVYAVPLKPDTLASTNASSPTTNAQAVRAGYAGASVSISSSNTTVGQITVSPVAFAAGDSTRATGFDPLGSGTSTLSLGSVAGFSTPSNYQTLTATVAAPAITVGSTSNLAIGKNLQNPLTLSLATAAPTGGVTVTVTSPDPTKLVLSTSPTVAGAATASATFAAGATTSTTKIYAQALVGTSPATEVTLTASAPGYSTGTVKLSLVPSGFVFYASVSPSTMSNRTFNSTTLSAPTTVGVYAVPLDPTTLNSTNGSTPTSNAESLRPGVSASVNVTSSNTAVGTITSSPLAFAAGSSNVNTTFQPATAGTSTLAISTPAGFTTPSNYQTLTATVTAPAITLGSTGNLAIGKNLVHPLTLTLATAAPTGGATVTFTSPDPAKVLLSTSPTAAGTASTSVTIPAGATTSTTKVYAHALVGTSPATVVNITAKAPGYADSSLALSLVPSGFVLYAAVSPYTMSGRSFNTTTLSANTTLGVYAVPLDPTTLNSGNASTPTTNAQAIRPGITAPSVTLNSTNTSMGTISPNPVAIPAGSSFSNTSFDPTNAGTGTLTLVTPAGFSTPSNYQTLTVTVAAPAITVATLSNYAIGKDMQHQINVTLAVAAPTGGVTVTLTSPDPAKLLLATSTTAAGTASVTVTIAGGSTTSTTKVYGQSLASSGTVNVGATATAYATSTGAITLGPSGFAFKEPTSTSFTTTTSSLPTTLKVYPVLLDPTTLKVVAEQTLRPGMSNTKVPVTSSTPSVGSISLSPVTFQGADSPNYQTTSFQPLTAGQSVLKVGAPTGFSVASDKNNITVTVN